MSFGQKKISTFPMKPRSLGQLARKAALGMSSSAKSFTSTRYEMFVMIAIISKQKALQIASLILLGASALKAADAVFSRIEAPFVGVRGGAMAWGDYDNDGYLDVVVTGDSGSAVTVLYHNNGDGTFSSMNLDFAGYRSSSVEWGDFDNDGYLDLLVTGISDGYARVYRNVGGTNFVEFMRLPAV